MFAYEFVRNAYLAGTFIALACGAIGWFVVLRGQVFAGDALSHVAFVGAIGAAAIGVNERVGLFLLTIALALAMGLLSRRAQADDVANASGVPVARLEVLFLLILALAIAATSQITGALLVFALLVAPPACAQQITLRPLAGLALSVVFALLIVWIGLGLAYFSIYPVGFYVTTLAFGLYVLVRAGRALEHRAGR